MTNRIEGKFCATIKNVDLSGASGFEFYVKQAIRRRHSQLDE